MATQTIRSATFSALKASILNTLADTDDVVWGLEEHAIVSEPDWSPMADGSMLSMRILSLNRPLTATPDDTLSEVSVRAVESVMRVTAFGPRAIGWLDTYVASLADPGVIEHVGALGFTIESDDDGLQDTSEVVGAREQLRAYADLLISCRAARDRVIVPLSEIVVSTDLNDSDQTGSFTVDVEE